METTEKTEPRKQKQPVRPKLSDSDKKTEKLIIRLTKEEKIRLHNLTKQGKYGCMSDYIRNKIFDLSKRKTLSLDNETREQLKSLGYELNTIGVNLNQLSKRMNSFSGYNIGDNDRQLIRHAYEMMRNYLITLQKYLH